MIRLGMAIALVLVVSIASVCDAGSVTRKRTAMVLVSPDDFRNAGFHGPLIVHIPVKLQVQDSAGRVLQTVSRAVHRDVFDYQANHIDFGEITVHDDETMRIVIPTLHGSTYDGDDRPVEYSHPYMRTSRIYYRAFRVGTLTMQDFTVD